MYSKVNFIYLLKLTEHFAVASNWNDNTMKALSQHANYLEDLAGDGMVYLAGRTQYEPGHEDLVGITMLSVEDEKEAQHILDNDPAIINKVMSATLHPYAIAIKSK